MPKVDYSGTKVFKFFYRKNEGRSLSNFWPCQIKIQDGEKIREYNSGESCFHGEKFLRVATYCIDENRRKALMEYGYKFGKGLFEKEGIIAKKMGRVFLLTQDELRFWAELSIQVQYEICRYKIENFDEVREDLQKTMGKILLHPAMRCSEEKVKTRIWEGKAIMVDGNIEILGKNLLGKIWMNLRDEINLRDETNEISKIE
jgi:predicted NAD-dependent protein-ADP-ribosyltransferase YbiA (DUF1768 family)